VTTPSRVKKAADDGVKTYVKAREDTADAGKAVAKFTEKQLKGTVDSAVAAGDRIREGKIADAVWHFSTDPLKKTSDNAAAAAAEARSFAPQAPLRALLALRPMRPGTRTARRRT
jgi:hypothetical protein